MTYWTVALMSQDADLLARVTACVAIEGERDPELWTQKHKWTVVGQPGWGAAWESALAGQVVDIGKSPAVITDQAILSAVQAINNNQQRSRLPEGRVVR